MVGLVLDTKKAIEKARALEKAGQGESAVKLFREAGATEDAARVLAGPLKRPRDAGQLLLESLGVQPPQTSWGILISDGQALIHTAPWLVMIPGAAIVLTVLSLNIFGDGLRDALDPRAKVRLEH